jgi:hypothetical protein
MNQLFKTRFCVIVCLSFDRLTVEYFGYGLRMGARIMSECFLIAESERRNQIKFSNKVSVAFWIGLPYTESVPLGTLMRVIRNRNCERYIQCDSPS